MPNEFIDRFIAQANGEYVKVYLYLLRHESATDEEIANELNLTLGDVLRARKFCDSVTTADTTLSAGANSNTVTQPSSSPRSIAVLGSDEEFSDMVFALGQYLQQELSQTDLESIAYMYDELGLPRDLIEYLVEICVQKGRKSLRYIEAIARNWHAKGIRTIDEARNDMELYAQEIGSVMKAFGISGRNPGREEMRYIATWFTEYGFSGDIVSEACNRTMGAIHQPNFKYTDTILSRWYDAGVKHLADIERLDKEHEARKNAAGTEAFSSKAYGSKKYVSGYQDVNSERAAANTRINEIKRIYDAILREDKKEQEERVAEVYMKAPRIKEIDETMSEIAIKKAKRAIAQANAGDLTSLEEELASLREEKEVLLHTAGFAPDYMLMHYICPDCKDTGFIDGKKCHCFIEKEKERA